MENFSSCCKIQILLILISLLSCIDELTSCLDTKISEFKNDLSAKAIWKLDHPDGPYYWFEDILGDGVEEVMDESCVVICITDYEGEVSNECEDHIFCHPRQLLWKK